MTIELGRPAFLLLLLLVPLFWWSFRRARGGAPLPWPDRLALVLRTVLIGAVALALAEPRWVETTEARATAFVQDISDSVPGDRREEAAAWIEKVLLDRKPEREDVAHVVFADGTGIERPFRGLGGLRPEDIRPLDPRRTGSVVPRGETDVEAGLKAAEASFPPEAARRVILLTDGNETRGDAEARAREMIASGIEVMVYPLRFQRRNEVLVEKVVAPHRARAGQPVEVRAVVRSTEDDQPAVVSFRDAAGRELAPPAEVRLEKGRKVYRIKQSFEEQGLHLVRASVEGVPGDGDAANNRGTAAIFAEGSPAVLVAAREPAEAESLRRALRRADLFVTLVPLSGLPQDPGALLPYECVVLLDAPAAEISPAQQRTLRAAVEETGIGLVAVGGPHSFSAGAWGGTPLEEVLPVTMDVSQKRVLPNGACVVVLHTCEFPQGNDWARTIAKAVVKSLGRNDYFGCVDWEGRSGGANWVVPLGKGDRAAMIAAINGSNPMDMPSLADCIGAGVKALEGANAYMKHMIVISDGDPMLPGKDMLDRMAQGGITVSAVAIAQHGPQDAMQPMTEATGGRYYALNEGEVQFLPAIFMKEAATVRRSTVFEEPFRPQVAAVHEILKGIRPDEIPPLGGYVVTTAKDRAEVLLVHPDPEKADPILAVWRKGLGVTSAFTSDFAGRWGKDWLAWDRYDRIVTQLVRACSRGVQRSAFAAQTEIAGGLGKIVVEAVDAEGSYVDGLAFTGTAIPPSGESRALRVLQTAPGRYEATFPASETGIHLLSLEHEVPGGAPGAEKVRAQVRAALPVDFSPEHLALESDEAFFDRLKAAGARILSRADRPFRDPIPEAERAADAWRWALLLAVLLFPLEVAARRLRLDPGPAVAALRARLAALRGAIPLPRPRPRAPTVIATDALATAGSAGEAAEAAARASKPGTAKAPSKETGPPSKAGPPGATDDLLRAKRRAKKQTRWEDTGGRS